MGLLCIGHRGASGHAPENTLKAFQLAIEMGCSWVELDVYAVEGELLVIHDDDVDRTTNGQGAVMAMSLTELRALDAGDGQQIPTLREVMDLCKGKVGINIELKGPDTARAVNKLLADMLLEGWDPQQIIISSFDHQELARADQQFQRGALFYKPANYVEAARALGAVSINLAQKLVNAEAVQEAHQAGFQVWVYTVNSFDEMLAMKNLGVDAVFTNYPDQCPK
jgi:glycerophosphoryl diester phosphodiesterase